MVRAHHSPMFVTNELLETRYKGAQVVLLAGSTARGEATASSDLDLVVIFDHIPQAYRESFVHRDWPIEAFVHDPETLRYFMAEVDAKCGIPSMPEMVVEGLEFPGPTDLSTMLKKEAAELLQRGPEKWSLEELDSQRYQISDLLDDLREPRSRPELLATASTLYNVWVDFYFRSRRMWSAERKSAVRRLKRIDPTLARRFTDSFDALYTHGDCANLIILTEEMLAPYGGVLFEGYQRKAPSTYRKR